MRIVQDSDDEFDENLEGEAPSKPDDALPDRHNNRSIGTGSTESLKRAIEGVHRAHFQSQRSQHDQQPSISFPGHTNKRRKTSANGAISGLSDSPSQRRESPMTPDRQLKLSFDNPSPDVVEDGRGIHATQVLDASHGADRNSQGKSRDINAIRHSIAMNLEPSSTIPNATFTQQLIMEAIRAPAMVEGAVVGTTNHLPQSSPPWSDWMRFTTATTGDLAQSSDRQQTTSNVASATSVPPAKDKEEDSEPERKIRFSSDHLRNYTEEIPGAVSPLQVIEQPSDANIVMDMIPVVSSDAYQTAQKEAGRLSYSRKRQVIFPPGSDDDLAAVDLSQEQYKPRPSRSRSAKTSLDASIDYSIRPEKAGKTLRRRNTTAITDSGSLSTTSRKIQQICDMGFTSSMAAGALEHNHGNIQRSVDWLVSNRIGEDELASPEMPKKRVASQKGSASKPIDCDNIEVNTPKNPKTESTVLKRSPGDLGVAISVQEPASAGLANKVAKDLATTIISSISQVKTPMVQVVIPIQSPRGGTALYRNSVSDSDEMVKHKGDDLNHHESEILFAPGQTALPKGTAAKKQGRGRPRKEVNVKMSVETAEEKEQIGSQDQVLQSFQSGSLPLESVVESSDLLRLDVPPILDHACREGDPSTSTTSPKTVVASKVSPIPEPLVKSSSHSSTIKTKVPYRVGLSKRVRIAPLLRAVKK